MIIKAGFLPQIKTIMQSMVDMNFPFKRSIEIARFAANQLEENIRLIEQQRIKLCKDMAKKDDKGEPLMNEAKTNYIISNAESLSKQIASLKEEAKKNSEPLPNEVEKLQHELNIENALMIDFQNKLIELSNLDVELTFNTFTQNELEKFKFPPRQLIVLGELGFIENYKNDEVPEQLGQIKGKADFKSKDARELKIN
jgi:hypothetical protein